MNDISHIFAILFLMLGPFKIIGPFTKMTMGTEPVLARNIAIRAITFSSIALLLAALIGDSILKKYSIPLPILALTGGLILFLVALLNVIQQYAPSDTQEKPPAPATLKMALYPLAFPIIVTPYGIAAVIVFLSLAPDQNRQLIIGAIVVGIMLLNLIMMLLNRYIFKFLAMVLPLLGAILGVVQVALGLQIIYRSLTTLLEG
jgi:multiple antibiotic resistance protein